MARTRSREEALRSTNLLELAPRAAAEWEEVDGHVVILRPKPVAKGLRGLWEKFRYFSASSRIRLDDMGSHAWRMMDGRHTVAEVANSLRDRFGKEVEPAEERAGQLVRMLRHEELVSYPGWDDGQG